MKIFETPEEANTYIDRKVNGGTEIIINDSVHFGVGSSVYSYSEDVKAAGLPATSTAFTRLAREDVGTVLGYLLKRDGYLST